MGSVVVVEDRTAGGEFEWRRIRKGGGLVSGCWWGFDVADGAVHWCWRAQRFVSSLLLTPTP